ncbi:MAG: hypothetical protein QXX38_01040 [Candidatus Aenigmatarchaeota archaeon]
MEIEDKNIFFSYALPCLENPKKKIKIGREEVRRLLFLHEFGEKIPDGNEKLFEVALFYLKKIAKKMGKKKIDKEVIRRYFLKEHNKIPGIREKCKVKFGKVLKVGKNPLVKVCGKVKKYRSFLDVRTGDAVVIHWNYIVDKPEKIKILVFGNPLLKENNVAINIAKKLKHELPWINFTFFDVVENLEKEGKNLIIMDVAKGIKNVEIIEDFKRIKREKIFSMHDFDLSFELRILKRLGLIESFKIICIPISKKKNIVQKLVNLLSDPSNL